MQILRSLRGVVAASCVAVIVALFGCTPGRASTIPERLDDSTFWSMVTEMSEPDGYFHSDNFVSNELGFQHVIDDIVSAAGRGSVYVGVGPDQNFTYVAALKPRIAFIVDIRRQNLLQHLMYKALIEMSSDRAEFLGRLFSRNWVTKPPLGLEADSLFKLLASLPRDSTLYWHNSAAIFDHLTQQRRFTLTTEDSASLQYVYKAFYDAGTTLTYSSSSMRGFNRGMPTYRTVLTATDADGVNRSYMGSDEAFATLKDLQHRNLIVPIVGDFAGATALKSVGEWIRLHEADVDAFYVSNVEQYLFQQGDAWQRFYTNVETMPRSSRALFIRSASNRGYLPRQHPLGRSSSLTSSISHVLDLYHSGELQSYSDVIGLSR